MTRASSAGAAARRKSVVQLGVLASTVALAWTALADLEIHIAQTFVSGTPAAISRSRMVMLAETASAPAPAPSSGESVALVKVTEESKMATAGVLGGLAGLLLGGVWVGGAAFAAASYFSRKEGDVSQALKGVAGGGLEVLNFGASLNAKYMVTDKLGSAITDAVEGAKSNPDSKEATSAVTGFFGGVTDAVKSLDQDVGIKDTLGGLVMSASDLAFQAVEKAVELNNEYKVSEQIAEKIQDVSKDISKTK